MTETIDKISRDIILIPEKAAAPPTKKSYNRYLARGLIAGAILIFGIGGWAATASIEGAVLAGGSIVVESQAKTLQHLEGGIVDEILVKNGDTVKAQDVVLRLNPTNPEADQSIVKNRLLENLATAARLKAELGKKPRITWPAELATDNLSPEISAIKGRQIELYTARQRAILGQSSQLITRIRQANDQITGLQDLRQSKFAQLEIIEKELSNLRTLLEKGFVSANRVMAVEREQVRTNGEIATHNAEVARLRSSIGEMELQIAQLQRDADAEILSELRKVESEITDLQSQLTSLDFKMQRIEVRAPTSGVIHDMAITTIGGVVMPGEAIMQIIPQNDRLIVEARVAPQDIDQVYKTQEASVNLSAFNQRTTPRLSGRVIDVSANTLVDEVSGLPYYTARIEIPGSELERLGDLKLIPGMPAEVFLTTGERTVADYLLKPFTDSMRRAFRED